MKLAACYTIFNGLELLEGSIAQIASEVDEIIICWQKVSNKGNISHEIEPFLEKIANKDYIFIEFVPDLSKNTKENERKKHNILIDCARFNGCTHAILAATDHYYKPDAFKKAKERCIKENWDVTFTKLYTYYKHPEWQLSPMEAYYFPFIFKLYPETRFERVSGFDLLVDPAAMMTTFLNWHLFNENTIAMHHYSMIRSNIRNKFDNAAASYRWQPEDLQRFISEYENAKLGDSISYFGGRKLIEAENIFGI